MRSQTTLFILAGAMLLLGPRLLNATPIPPGPRPQCHPTNDPCAGHINPKNFEAAELNMASECLQRLPSYELNGSVNYENCADTGAKQLLSRWLSHARQHLSRDEIVSVIWELKFMDINNVSMNFIKLREKNLVQCLVWLDHVVAFGRVIEQLNEYNKGFPSITIMSIAFHGTSIEDSSKSFEEFYSTWSAQLLNTNNLGSTLADYERKLTTLHSTMWLEHFRATWERSSIGEINAAADHHETTGLKEYSEMHVEQSKMHITESLLLRYIGVRNQLKYASGRKFVDVEIQRLDALRHQSLGPWLNLRGLLTWLHSQYSHYASVAKNGQIGN
ncbi:hypothetical protein H0H93_016775 [Arthromyces matolae]|nr:hypothetical protein H0H93_016775 [Arthromyces matolae]